jgi:hypothetical protein
VPGMMGEGRWPSPTAAIMSLVHRLGAVKGSNSKTGQNLRSHAGGGANFGSCQCPIQNRPLLRAGCRGDKGARAARQAQGAQPSETLQAPARPRWRRKPSAAQETCAKSNRWQQTSLERASASCVSTEKQATAAGCRELCQGSVGWQGPSQSRKLAQRRWQHIPASATDVWGTLEQWARHALERRAHFRTPVAPGRRRRRRWPAEVTAGRRRGGPQLPSPRRLRLSAGTSSALSRDCGQAPA